MMNTTTARIAARYIPTNSLPIAEESGLGIVYVYPAGKRYGVIAYRGNAGKRDFHYSFKSDKEVDVCIERFFAGLRSHQERVNQSRARVSQPHTLKAGDIVVNSWGYDQTNVDWYQVTKTTANYVWLQPVSGSTECAEGYSPMAGLSSPAIDTEGNDPAKWGFTLIEDRPAIKRRASGENVTMRHGCGRKWDGKAKYESWYA